MAIRFRKKKKIIRVKMNMKNKYISPQTEVMEIEGIMILVGSMNNGIGGDAQEPAKARGYYDWDEDDLED